MSRIWFTADTHFSHKLLTRLRGFEEDIGKHDSTLINNWNSCVQPGDEVYHLGDFALCRPDRLKSVRAQLNGQIYLIRGNHDKTADQCSDQFAWIKDVYNFKREGLKIWLSHYCHTVWKASHHGSWHLYGHCVDKDTEILTEYGWKSRDEIIEGEGVFSYNHKTRSIEKDQVKEIIDVNYSGNVYRYFSKSIDMRVTPNHTIIWFNRHGAVKSECEAKEFFARKQTRVTLRKSGIYKDHPDLGLLGLSNDLLKLYILIAADGTIKPETKLVKFGLTRQRKIDYLISLLDLLKIEYKSYKYKKSKSTSVNFYLPKQLENWQIKGLDDRLMFCNQSQLEAILEAYHFSDGVKTTSGGTLIYSAKEKEIDLLQAVATLNGYSSTKYSRYHGFGSNLQHQLSLSKKELIDLINVSKKVITETTKNESFWCIKTNNQNFFMRRNGRVHLTGNSHGGLPENNQYKFDVGVDAWNLFPVSLEQVIQKMETKSDLAIHHTDRRTG